MECANCHRTGFTADELDAHTGTEACQRGITPRALADHVKLDECEFGLMAAPSEDPRVAQLETRIAELERVSRTAIASGNAPSKLPALEGGHDRAH